MKACGLIVEYNPFHNGHVYHLQQSKKIAHSDVSIAVMSGSFLQRGEPAMIDKFHRAKAALQTGIDIVVELPYVYSVQHSDLFAEGALHILNELGVSTVCFGSEFGEIEPFIQYHDQIAKHKDSYQLKLKQYLHDGMSYPAASMKSMQDLGLIESNSNLTKPNNILGLSYVKAIRRQQFPIKPLTIKRMNNDYHDTEITNEIASATSIRRDIFSNKGKLSKKINATLPTTMIQQLQAYHVKTKTFHNWEAYFPYLLYRVHTMSPEELRTIHGIEEGIEYRIIETAQSAINMSDWLSKVKTKRYTWTRIQRIFTHILTNTKKATVEQIITQNKPIPALRLLGMTDAGKSYLRSIKKALDIPIITSYKRNMPPLLQLDEKASRVYYSILPANERIAAFKQELQKPLQL